MGGWVSVMGTGSQRVSSEGSGLNEAVVNGHRRRRFGVKEVWVGLLITPLIISKNIEDFTFFSSFFCPYHGLHLNLLFSNEI